MKTAVGPARREQVEQWIKRLNPRCRKYATEFLDWIWWRKGQRPQRGRLSPIQQQKIDSKLAEMFSTNRT